MKSANRVLALLLGIIAFLPSNPVAEAHRLGIWNIEYLSPTKTRGFPERAGQIAPRGAAELKKIATLLKNEVKADALVVTEIEADEGSTSKPRSSQLNTITGHLGGEWEYRLATKGGDQRVGILYNTSKVKLKTAGEMSARPFYVQGDAGDWGEKPKKHFDVYDRDPIIFWLALLDDSGSEMNDMIVVGLHLKSGQPNIHNHMAAVAKLVGDLGLFKQQKKIPSSEKDVIIMGDLNDSSHNRKGFKYIFDYFDAVGYTHLGGDTAEYPATRINGSQIDHILVSNKLFKRAVVTESFEVFQAEPDELDQYREIYSDHYPLIVEINSYEDDD